MFRKLVSNLAFSPALVGQLGFYAKRLRKEEATRRIGLVFTVLALVVQTFAVFSPPEAANASHPSNFIKGGVSSVKEYLRHYDQNDNNIKDLFNSLGIKRSDIAKAKSGKFNSKDVYSWGLTSRFSKGQGERTYTVKTSNGGQRTFFYRPLDLWDSHAWSKKHGTTYSGFVGKTSSGMYFALMKECGNLILKVVPPAPKCPSGYIGKYPKCSKPPKMCTIPGKTNLPANSPNCKQNPVAACSSLKIIRFNNTYQLDATATAQYGATVSSYIYTVKKDGKTINTYTEKSGGKLTNTKIITATQQGNYQVILTVKTSLGDKTSSNCAKTFSIPAPKMCPVNPQILESSPECQPCPGDTTLWIKDEKCAANIIYTKTANNITQDNVDATKATAQAGDKIIFTLNISNDGKNSSEVAATDDLSDVAEYADVVDTGGASYDESSSTLTWPTFTLKPGEERTRIFTVQVKSDIPAMGTGVSDKTSYDCKMINTFGNAVTIDVDCPIQKQVVEQTVEQLPHTGPRENMIFAGVVITIVTYFYARSRQVKKEIRLIRRDLNAGTI